MFYLICFISIQCWEDVLGWEGLTPPQPQATGVCEKNTPPGRKTLGETNFEQQEIRGWRADSAAALQGQASRKRSVLYV